MMFDASFLNMENIIQKGQGKNIYHVCTNI